MIWPDAVVDAGTERQKQLEYAKDLELQIELRRAIQREQQQDQEALERKFQPDDHSPAKWLIEGGYTPRPDMQRADYYNNNNNNNGYRSPPWFQQQQQPSPWSQMNSSLAERPATSSTPSRRPSSTSTSGVQASAAAGQPSGLPSIDRDHANAHTRFRITDLHSQDDRLRERAQQMEWKRILDEQIREKARIKQQEEEEQKRSEREEAQEETMFLRDQQLRAQRRLGYHVPPTASQPQPNIYTMQHSPPPQQQYEPTSDSPHDQEHSDYRQRFEPPILTEDGYVFNEPQRNEYHKNYYTTPDDNGAPMPPPAPFCPSYSPMPPMNANHEVQQQSTQSYDAFTESRSHLISEYRSLLADIRRERDELRQEKEELRKEKEELRLERALLQLENEKMATFLETQRRWRNEEQSQRSFRPHSSGDNVMLSSPLREYNTPSLSTPQRSPQGFDRSMQMHQMERSFAALGLGRDVPRTPIREQPKPSPISMDDFMAVTPQNRLTPNVMDSPRIKRLSQFRGFRATTATQHEEEALPSTANSLDQSLVGESVFVSLSPDEIEAQDARTAGAGREGGPPRITETVSPRRGKDASERGTSDRNNMLRNSRVIKSRGFYNIEKELKALSPHRATTNERSKAEQKATDAASAAAMMEKSPARRRHESRRRRHERSEKASGNSARRGSQSLSPAYRPPQRRSRRDHENDEEDEQKEEEPKLSRSLFQVKVLV
uniref:CCDC66 domain-containing protein n=1 Tax=Globisporangium ultimum (strain ATCC 200006 / CBS 805.95 / DAOM BR144) TaxID=431595 RepID=K3W6X6_GLOUD